MGVEVKSKEKRLGWFSGFFDWGWLEGRWFIFWNRIYKRREEVWGKDDDFIFFFKFYYEKFWEWKLLNGCVVFGISCVRLNYSNL